MFIMKVTIINTITATNTRFKSFLSSHIIRITLQTSPTTTARYGPKDLLYTNAAVMTENIPIRNISFGADFFSVSNSNSAHITAIHR
ncbi:hypothetical protein psyc5s11_13140 [Clostridium gelidum]|uniref:Uncharacterized protein n=1 Tax=Clostridium gelidum TaxID=704125 RepID=A0ABM7T8K0_9CLOT|nr:hypothetical protein psyc5s11_13140 [Clostridium gelidum]